MHEFGYVKFDDLNQALDFLSETDNVSLLQGGTDLMVDLRHGVKQPKHVANIKSIPELNVLEETDEGIEIGAAIPLNHLLKSDLLKEKVPVLYQGCHEIASFPIRNRATLGGNICTSSPAADTSSALYCLDARVKIASRDGKREVHIEEFFQGPKQNALKPGEIVTSVIIPKPYPTGKGVYYKLSRTNSVDLASIGVALQENNGKVKIAINACAPTPVRATSVEKAVNEENETDFKKAAALVEQDIKPIDDIRGSAEYRYHTAKVLVRRGLEETMKGGQ